MNNASLINNQNADKEIKAEKLLNELLLNVVLKELPTQDLRKEFYNLLLLDDYDKVDTFIQEHIPNFQDKLVSRVQELLSE